MGKSLRNVTWRDYHAPMPQNGVHLNGKAIKAERTRSLLTIEQLAALADIHPNTLQRMESDETYRASFKTIKRVARELSCSPTPFVRETEEVA